MGNITGNHYSTGNISRSDSSPPLSCPDLELLVLACLWSTNTRLWFISSLHKLGIFLKLHQKWSKSNHKNANLKYFLIQLYDRWQVRGRRRAMMRWWRWWLFHVPTTSVSKMTMQICPTEYQYILVHWLSDAKIISRRILLSDLIRDLSPVNWGRCGWSFNKTIKWSQYNLKTNWTIQNL